MRRKKPFSFFDRIDRAALVISAKDGSSALTETPAVASSSASVIAPRSALNSICEYSNKPTINNPLYFWMMDDEDYEVYNILSYFDKSLTSAFGGAGMGGLSYLEGLKNHVVHVI